MERVRTSSELMRSPSISKIHARIAGRLEVIFVSFECHVFPPRFYDHPCEQVTYSFSRKAMALYTLEKIRCKPNRENSGGAYESCSLREERNPASSALHGEADG